MKLPTLKISKQRFEKGESVTFEIFFGTLTFLIILPLEMFEIVSGLRAEVAGITLARAISVCIFLGILGSGFWKQFTSSVLFALKCMTVAVPAAIFTYWHFMLAAVICIIVSETLSVMLIIQAIGLIAFTTVFAILILKSACALYQTKEG
jgi:hypothetical protein